VFLFYLVSVSDLRYVFMCTLIKFCPQKCHHLHMVVCNREEKTPIWQIYWI